MGLVLSLNGCGAISTYQLMSISQVVDQAREAGADEYAIYEYTMAERYLEKAYEETGHADYKIAVELGRQSEEWALKALRRVETSGRDAELRSLQEALPNLGEQDQPIIDDEEDDIWNEEDSL
jgi:HEPN domain-containing protein